LQVAYDFCHISISLEDRVSVWIMEEYMRELTRGAAWSETARRETRRAAKMDRMMVNSRST
jgi:hypothetical protein